MLQSAPLDGPGVLGESATGGDGFLSPPVLDVRLEAIESLYRETNPALERFVTRLGLSPHDAEDVVAESFATLWRLTPERYDALQDLRAYLFVVARHLAYRHLAESGRVVATTLDHFDREVVSDPDVAVEKESALLSRAALSTLSWTQQRVLWASLVEGLSARAIAAELGTSITNVTTQAQRARAALRQAYLVVYLNSGPRECDFDTAVLAKGVLGTASRRQQHTIDTHIADCLECRGLSERGAEEMRAYGVSGVVVVGGMTLGWLADSRPATPPTQEAGPSGGQPNGLARALLTTASIALLLIGPSFGVFSGQRAQEHGIPDPETSACDDCDGVSISAQPQEVQLPMPAPGHSESWPVRVTNHSDSSTDLAVELSSSFDDRSVDPVGGKRLQEAPHFTFEINGQPLSEPLSAAAYSGRLLYLGRLEAHRSVTVTVTVSRLRGDVDQHLSGVARVRISAGADVPRDSAAGTLIDPPDGYLDALPATGPVALRPLVLADLAILIAGLVVTYSVRRTRARPYH